MSVTLSLSDCPRGLISGLRSLGNVYVSLPSSLLLNVPQLWLDLAVIVSIICTSDFPFLLEILVHQERLRHTHLSNNASQSDSVLCLYTPADHFQLVASPRGSGDLGC